MALAPLAPIDRATLLYVAVALGFTLARGPRTWPAVALLPPWLVRVAFYTQVGLVDSASGVSHDARRQRWEAVYGQFHYAVDALAGAALAAVVLIAGRRGEYHSVLRSPSGRTDPQGETP